MTSTGIGAPVGIALKMIGAGMSAFGAGSSIFGENPQRRLMESKSNMNQLQKRYEQLSEFLMLFISFLKLVHIRYEQASKKI